MRVKRYAGVCPLVSSLCLVLGCAGAGGSSGQHLGNQILYVVSNGTITTYGIDPSSLDATLAEQPVALIPSSAALLQFIPSPHDNFVYAVWSDGRNVPHLSVFQTDSFGVPQLPAIQELHANSLSQFNIHPRGRFAYMLEVTSSNNLYWADIRLFTVQQGSGKLIENPQVQGRYGPAFFWPAFLYGFSADGTKLYDTSTSASGAVYRQRSIDLNTGVLGADRQIFSTNPKQEVVLGKVIVEQYEDGGQGYINIFPETPEPGRATIHCSAAMLRFCATATDVELDKSGNYLFMTDPDTQAVHVAVIRPSVRQIHDTRASFPMTSQTPGFAFSQDGSIIYAMLAEDSSVHFYHFDSSRGSLKEAGTPLPLGSGSGICPAER
jgi:hypothetical protein